MWGNWKLTPEQQDFAAEHHDRIVFGFLRRKKLNHDDEYYTVVIYQYLYSVKIYLERPELRKWTFQAIAWRNMSGAVYRYWQKENRLPTCSLDAVQPHTERPRLETMAAPDDVPMEVEYRELVRWILASEQMERKVSA